MNRSPQEVAVTLDIQRDTLQEEVPGLISDLMILTKVRLTLMVLVTTFVGFCWASESPMNWVLLLWTVLGTCLVAASAQVFNQVLEKDVDRLMERTRHRPLPALRMGRKKASLLGGIAGSSGLLILGLGVNTLALVLAASTLAIYLGLYTPLKRRTPLCIALGAVAGAIPPLIGWVAVRPVMESGAWILFGILFCWQMPHFLAIAWMYRDEYAQAGFVMLRRRDTNGMVTASESMIYSLLLTLITLAPYALGLAGIWYLTGVLLCNSALLWYATRFVMNRTRASARRLFFCSIIYLPVLLSFVVFAKPQ